MESLLTQEQKEKLSALRFEADKELTSIVGKIKNRKSHKKAGKTNTKQIRELKKKLE